MLLTNADLDHVLGLFALREGKRFQVYATDAVRAAISECLGLTGILDAFCGASWSSPPLDFAPLAPVAPSEPADLELKVWRGLAEPGLLFRAIPLAGTPPPFARKKISGGIHSVAYQFLDPKTGGRLLVAPDVAVSNPGLESAIQESNAVLLDGTFWSGDELARVKSGGATAEQMGHVTIRDASMELLRKSPARHKIYIHINNTNPILSPGSTERAAVESAGIVVGHDGMELDL